MNEILLLSNPGKRKNRRKSKAKRSHRRRKSARRSHSRRKSVRVHARRNPVSRITGSVMPTIKGGFVGALGGLGNDLLYGYGKRFLPAVLQAGYGRHATKILSAVVVGIAGNYVLKGKGQALATGAATVAIHEALKEQLATFAPSLPLGAMDEQPGLLGYDAAMPVDGDDLMGEYIDSGVGDVGDMGEYIAMSGDDDGM